MNHVHLPFLVIFGAANIACGGVLFDPPEGWIDLELANGYSADIEVLEGYSDPDGGIRIVLTQLARPVLTRSGAEDMMRDQLSSMEATGFQHKETKLSSFKGFEAMFQSGRYPQPDAGPTFALENHAVFSDSAVLSISLAYDPASASPETARAVLDLVKVPGSPIKLTAGLGSIPGDSAAERTGYLVGRVVGYVLFAALGVIGLRALVKKAHGDRERIIKAQQGAAEQSATPPRVGD